MIQYRLMTQLYVLPDGKNLRIFLSGFLTWRMKSEVKEPNLSEVYSPSASWALSRHSPKQKYILAPSLSILEADVSFFITTRFSFSFLPHIFFLYQFYFLSLFSPFVHHILLISFSNSLNMLWWQYISDDLIINKNP